ncbi:MAG TPA: hypothetical protein VF633_06490 [Brevundimonas sp.]|jgi:hypothetical protein
MRLMALPVCLVASLSLAACATVGADDVPSGPPTVIRAPGEPAPAQAKLYADCLAASVVAGTYEKEPGADLLRLTCTGGPARAFYDGLAVWSTTGEGSEIVAEGRTWRYTQKIEKSPFGLDDCSTDGTADYRCTIILTVGKFLSAQ